MRDLLVRLSRINRTVVFLVTLAWLLVALFVPRPFSGIMLLILVAGLVAVAVQTWPVQPIGTRVLRVLTLVLITGAAITRLG